MNSYIVLFVVALAYFGSEVSAEDKEATTLPSASESPCASKFKEDPNRANVSAACVEKTKLTPADLPEKKEDFIKTFDDKCYGKCLLEDLGMLKDLKFNRDAIKADILEHVVDKEFQTKITDYTMKCMDEAEKEFKPLTEANVCKASAKLLFCCKEEEGKLPC